MNKETKNQTTLTKKYKISVFLTVFLIIFSLQGVDLTKAESVSTSLDPLSQECKLNEVLDELLAVKDGLLTGIARDRAEIKARKAVIAQSIICAKIEILETNTRLSELKLNSIEDEALRSQFLTLLLASENQYSSYGDLVEKSTGLIDVKNLAENILSWRKSEYLKLLSNINDFILVINNEEFIKIARARFEKINSTISILWLSNVSSIKNLLNESDALTTKAKKLNTGAHKIVGNYYVPIYSASSASSTASSTATSTAFGKAMLIASGTPVSTTSTTISSEVSEKNSTSTSLQDETSTQIPTPTPTRLPTVVSLIKESIVSLQGAYENYFEISVIVKNILGL